MTESAIDARQHLTPAQRAIAITADKWGYFGGTIKRREKLWKDRKVLDIGMGGGPHSIPFIVRGAKSYTGVDPRVGTDQVRDLRSNRDPSIPPYHRFPYSADEMMRAFPNLKLYSGIMEDIAQKQLVTDAEFIILNAVSEHLRNPLSVIQSAFDAAAEGAVIWIAHANYYSWTGHHRPPRTVSQFDPGNAQHVAVTDWKHLEPEHPCYSNVNLNRMRLGDFRDVIDKFFEIVEWREQTHARERLTPELRRRWKKYSPSELLDQWVFVSAVRRERPKPVDLSNRQLHHPREDYLADADYSGEDIRRYEFSNTVFFTPKGSIASHTYNDHGGRKIIERLREGDRIKVQKFPDLLTLTVRQVHRPKSGAVTATFEEEISQETRGENRLEWVIVDYPSPVI